MTRHIIPISGKDSLCTALVQKARADLPYEYLFCDVRMELPETYAWLNRVEGSLGINLIRVGKSLENIIAEQEMLPRHSKRFCTKYGKIFPMQNFVGKDEAIQYVGIRADEGPRADGLQSSPNIVLKYPLVEMNIDLQGVYKILDRHGLLPPNFFWQSLYQLVLDLCDASKRGLVNDLKPWEFSLLFSWRSRSNCFMCFYQRQYEWVGLLEHHPELFLRAENLEQDYGSIGGSNRMKNFYFHEGMPLSWIRSNKDKILKDRAVKVFRAIQKLESAGEGFDELSSVSCGMYCGK